jgi:hypothetical protein
MENQKIYNPLNLPAQIWASELCDIDFQSITYVYSIDGVKLQQIVQADGPTTSTDYYGPMVLNDGELKKIRHSYGQMREIDGDFEPVFHIADHLGSPRVIFWDEDGDGVVREDEVLERIDAHPPAVAVHSLKGPPDLWFCSADSFTKLQCVNPFGLEHVAHPRKTWSPTSGTPIRSTARRECLTTTMFRGCSIRLWGGFWGWMIWQRNILLFPNQQCSGYNSGYHVNSKDTICPAQSKCLLFFVKFYLII